LQRNIILRTDSEEDLNYRIEVDASIDAVFCFRESDSVAALKYGLKKGVKFRRSFLSLVLPDGILSKSNTTTFSLWRWRSGSQVTS
jgi:LacI family transcriptional regulator